MAPNPYLLAADNPEALVELLNEDDSLATGQDEHGYSLVHAAASYNHLDLLRILVHNLKVPVDLKDEDGETALFVVESVAAARVLVEELGLDPTLTNEEGMTAREKIESEEDWPEVAEYLKKFDTGASTANGTTNGDAFELPSVPEGLRVTVGTMDESETADQPVDPEFCRRIEALAARADFDTPEGQAELRQLVEDTIIGQGLGEDQNIRQRQD
ncbi:hypothetical protein B0H67DRAFT_254438 [Lasiosphaeris hirsuta]|uniref:Ankyrin repeat protein n=1 Tax=Lasiosphaeris hirsuta TaxID=260670 RepID=A0AA40DY44_9PEZI|nr:hypothetical protein B0H67DRAFT_254438 [Lasiosphaeris hirsuta]